MKNKKWQRIFLFLFFQLAALGSLRADWFVVTDSKESQQAAQKIAVTTGGWVLPAALYPKLKSSAYHVVRGPYSKPEAAKKELRFLQSDGGYKPAHLVDAGACLLPSLGHGTGGGSALLAALLGELSVTVTENKGGANPCEPDEPYFEVTLGYMGASRKEVVTAEPAILDLNGFRIIKSTGAIEHMRICTE